MSHVIFKTNLYPKIILCSFKIQFWLGIYILSVNPVKASGYSLQMGSSIIPMLSKLCVSSVQVCVHKCVGVYTYVCAFI